MAWSGDIFQLNLEGEHAGLKFCIPSEGVVIWTDNMCIPVGAENPVDAITYMDYVYQPADPGRDRDLRELHLPGARRRPTYIDPSLAKSPLIFPTADRSGEDPHLLRLQDPGRAEPVELAVPSDLQGRPKRERGRGALSTPSVEEIVKAGTPLIERRKPSRNKKLAPYELLAPGTLYLAIFFLIPIGYMFYTSLQSGFIGDFHFNWHFANYSNALKLHGGIYVRFSVLRRHLVTLFALLFAYPVAYWIAFYGGKRKSVFLFLLLLPFFVSFIIRTVEWQFLLRDDGTDPRAAEADRAAAEELPRTRHQCRGDRRHHVQLPAVHRPAAVRGPRADRQASGRGGQGSVREQVHHVPQDRVAVALPGFSRRSS